MLLDIGCCFFFTLPPISPIMTIASVCGSSWEQLEDIDKVGTRNRITTNTYTRRLTEPGICRLLDRFVSQGAGTRHNPDLAWFVNVSGHNPDLALTRV